MKSKSNFFIISKYRNVLFGVAICMIMVFHFFEDRIRYTGSDSWLTKFFNQTVVGVEMFLFLSGIGLYFSLKNNSNILQFFKKRFIRIIIPALLTIPMFWFLYECVFQNKPDRFWPNVSFASFFTDGNAQFWFVITIMIFYLIFPLLFWFFELPKNMTPVKREIVNLVQLCVLLVIVFGGLFLLRRYNKELYSNWEVAISRIAVFIIGTYFGHLVYEKKNLNKIVLILFVLGMVAVVGVKIYFTITRPFTRIRPLDAVFAVAICYFVSVFFDFIKQGWLEKIFCFFGSMTLELYIIHVSLRACCNLKQYFVTYIPWHYAVVIGFSVLYAWVVKAGGDKIISNITKPKKLKTK